MMDYLDKTQISNLGDIVESTTSDSGEQLQNTNILFVGMIKQMVSFLRYYKCSD